MPIIQLPINDDELADLLKMTGEKTGTKALRTVIAGYMELMNDNQQLKTNFSKLDSDYTELSLWAEQLSKSLQFFNQFPSRNRKT